MKHLTWFFRLILVVILTSCAARDSLTPATKSTPTVSPAITAVKPPAVKVKPTTSPATPVSNISLIKIGQEPIAGLRWDEQIRKFVYFDVTRWDEQRKQFVNLDPTDTSSVAWHAFDPIHVISETYDTPTATSSVNEKTKTKLGTYQNYVSLSPTGRNILFLRAEEDTAQSLLAYKYVEVWSSDKEGNHARKLGDIPLPWSQVIWLDDHNALLIVTFESIDSGVQAYTFTIDGQGSSNLFEKFTDIRGVPENISISPNGHWIAVTTFGEGQENSLWVINRMNDSIRRVDSADGLRLPLWSNDSQYVYYIHSDTIALAGYAPTKPPIIAAYNTVTGQIASLTSEGDIQKPLISEWAVSGDGRYFVFEADSALGFLDGGLWLVSLQN